MLILLTTASMIRDMFFEKGVANADELPDIIQARPGYHFLGQSAERAIIKK